MAIALLATGLTILVALWSIYAFRPSVQFWRGPVGSARSDWQPLPPEGVHKQDGTKLGSTSPSAGQGSLSLSVDPSDQEPEKQTATLTAKNPERVTHGSSQESGQAGGGFFNNAQNVIMYQPVMNNISDTKEKVLKWLAKFTMPGVEFDASGHVPGCHPGTRIAILQKLYLWVNDPQRAHQILWLRGAAGVGKSAILQSLAEQLSEDSKLGATLFFSRPNNRNDSAFAFPTIAYQLAVRIPPYKEYLEQIMLRDPKLLEKDLQRQFDALVVEPFTKLGLGGMGYKWAVLLDGLDECDGESAQILVIKLISRFCCQYPASPLVWVIASRPEAHLQLTFASREVVGSLEEFIVAVDSDDACRDVEKFLRAKFRDIHQDYRDLMPTGAPWPEERDITRISKTSSGLFALATTVVRYIEDPHVCNPISQLATVLSVTEGLEPGSLSALYAFYSAILGNVPQAMSPILKLLLPFYAVLLQELTLLTGNDSTPSYFPLVIVATIFGLQQHTVYGALRKLHSVIKVPSLNESGFQGIEFHHASFSDYLKTQGGYTLDSRLMTKMWWGNFNLLHGIDSISYHNATSGGRPPVPLSWDVKLADGVSEDLWGVGLQWLLHTLVPECKAARGFSCSHPHVSLTGVELCNAFEKINFSRLFLPFHNRLGFRAFNFFDWLANTVPPELVQLDLIRPTSLSDLDLTYMVEKSVALELKKAGGAQTNVTAFADPKFAQPGRTTYPIEKLASKLDELVRREMAIRVLLVGKAPDRRCAFIYAEHSSKKWSLLYFVPYCK